MNAKSKITPAFNVQCGRQPVICNTLDEALAAWITYLQALPAGAAAEGGEVRFNGRVVALFTVSGEVL